MKINRKNADPADSYGRSLVEYQFDGEDIFVISDLHMGAGRQHNGNYNGCENFFADNSFARFVRRLMADNSNAKKLLIINGDLVDFLRITDVPRSAEDLKQWHQILQKVGINKSTVELHDSILDKEIKYGFKTDDFKSVWKLHICARGHPKFFASLGHWLSEGNKLIITKGNHDLEWFWPAVREYMELLVAERIAAVSHFSNESALAGLVKPNLLFVDDKLIINKMFYIEHGHRYERFTKVDGPPVLKNETELNLPFGSFFNRYLINRVELAYPYIDNVRPRGNILSVLIRERFPLAVKLLFNYVPFALKVIPKRQYDFAFRYLFQFLWMIVLPVLVMIGAFWYLNPVTINFSTPNGILCMIFNTLKNSAFLILSYFSSRLFAMLKLSSPDSLYKNAEQVMVDHPEIMIVTFGHTHNPEQKETSTLKRYYNTGTWIPVFQTSAADVRLDRTYTFLWLGKNPDNTYKPASLIRWNDDAERTDELFLMDHK